MPEPYPDLLDEIEDPTPEAERIAAALADCNAAIDAYADDEDTHYGDCYLDHASCLAHRIRRTLTGEDAATDATT